MSDESIFLKQIAAHPEDRAIRLVYADWLEDRGDPRAELIRVEEAMRSVPIFSDRYWELKPRRNALRPAFEPELLAALGYGTDYEPVFAEIPDDWKGRWRLIREFVERWHGIPMADVGDGSDRVRKVEFDLGYDLSPAVREWVAFASGFEAEWFEQVMGDFVGFEEVPGHPVLTILIQNPPTHRYAVNKADLSLDDPPVDVYYLGWGNDWRYGERDESRFTTFSLKYAIASAGSSERDNGYILDYVSSEEIIPRLNESFPSQFQLENTLFFEGLNTIIRLNPRWGTPRDMTFQLSIRGEDAMAGLPEFLHDLARETPHRGGLFSQERYPRQ
jgi:uncharacterized protein (TIGR02996 family)